MEVSHLGEKEWRETKFNYCDGNWIVNRKSVRGSSLLTAELMLSAYVRVLNTYARGSLIDLGCGNSPLYGIYRLLTDQITWADWEQSLHDEFTKDIILDLNKPLDIRSDSFDTVVLSDVLEHIIYPDDLMMELSRITRRNGNIIIGVPFLYWLHEQPYDFHRYTRFKLERMAHDAELEILEISETGGGWDVVHDVIMKILFSRTSGIRSSYLLYTLYSFLRKRWPLRKNIDKWKGRIPLGYIVVFRKKL